MLHSMLRVHDCNMEEGISCCSKLHAQLLTDINGWKLSQLSQLRYHSHLLLCVLRRVFASGYQTPAIALFQAKSRQSPLTLWQYKMPAWRRNNLAPAKP